MLLLLQPLWGTVLSLVQAKGNKDDRSAQAVQDKASLRQRQQERAPRWHRDPKLATCTAVTALRQRFGRRRWGWLRSHASGFLGMIVRASPRGKGPFRGNTLECGVLHDLLTSLVAVSEYYVCGTSVRSKVRKDKRCSLPNLYLNWRHNRSVMIFQNFQKFPRLQYTTWKRLFKV